MHILWLRGFLVSLLQLGNLNGYLLNGMQVEHKNNKVIG